MKAILVIDMPKSCEDCRLADFGKCWGSNSYLHLSTKDRPKECPLRPMPKKKMPKHGEMFPQDMRLVDRWKGYDMCIDEILGEAE